MAKNKTTQIAKPQAQSAAATGPVTPAPEARGSKVPWILDSRLHATLHEGHRTLVIGQDAFAKVIDQVEGQYVRPLLNAHDGDSEACQDIKDQIAAFRALYR